MLKLSEKKISKSVENSLWKQISSNIKTYPLFYTVVTYATWLEGFNYEYGEFSDINKLKKTHRLLRNIIKESLKTDDIYFFQERHSPSTKNYHQIYGVPEILLGPLQ